MNTEELDDKKIENTDKFIGCDTPEDYITNLDVLYIFLKLQVPHMNIFSVF